MISSARHSAIVLMLRNDDSRAPVVIRYSALRRQNNILVGHEGGHDNDLGEIVRTRKMQKNQYSVIQTPQETDRKRGRLLALRHLTGA